MCANSNTFIASYMVRFRHGAFLVPGMYFAILLASRRRFLSPSHMGSMTFYALRLNSIAIYALHSPQSTQTTPLLRSLLSLFGASLVDSSRQCLRPLRMNVALCWQRRWNQIDEDDRMNVKRSSGRSDESSVPEDLLV